MAHPGVRWTLTCVAAMAVLGMVFAPANPLARAGWNRREPEGRVQESPAAGQMVYLPLLLGTSANAAMPAGTPRLEDLGAIGGSVERLAIRGDNLYLGVGSTVVTYDIRLPGAARRLGQSAQLWGRVAHMAMGSDRLFVTTRPDFDADGWSAAHGTASRHPEAWPPWTVLSVFDVEDPSQPRLLHSQALRVGQFNLFALDLSAWERTAYLSVMDQSPRHDRYVIIDSCPGPGCGLLVAEATETGVHLNLRGDLMPFAFRLLAHAGQLHAEGIMSPSDRDRLGTPWGMTSYDLSRPATPRVIGGTGHREFRSQAGRNLAAERDRVYRFLGPDGVLITTDVGPDREPRILGLEGLGADQVWAGVPRVPGFHLPYYSASTVVEHDRLHMLVPADPGRVASLDVRDPLEPRLIGQTSLKDLAMWTGRNRTGDEDTNDGGLDIDAADDGRIFVATGQAGQLIEMTSVDGPLRELKRYAEGGSGGCALVDPTGRMIHHNLRSGLLEIRRLEQGGAGELESATHIGGRGSCALVQSGPRLYVVSDDNLTIIDLELASAPVIRGRLALQGEPSQVVVDGDELYVAMGILGLWVVDVSDADAPLTIARVVLPGQIHGLALDGTGLYVAAGTVGLVQLDISDPTAPVEVGGWLAGEDIRAVARRGGWLHVLSAREPESLIQPGTTELVSLEMTNDARVRSRIGLAPGGSGALALGGPGDRSLFVLDGALGVRLFDIESGVPVALDLLASPYTLRDLSAGGSWVVGIGEDSLRLMRRR